MLRCSSKSFCIVLRALVQILAFSAMGVGFQFPNWYILWSFPLVSYQFSHLLVLPNPLSRHHPHHQCTYGQGICRFLPWGVYNPGRHKENKRGRGGKWKQEKNTWLFLVLRLEELLCISGYYWSEGQGSPLPWHWKFAIINHHASALPAEGAMCVPASGYAKCAAHIPHCHPGCLFSLLTHKQACHNDRHFAGS